MNGKTATTYLVSCSDKTLYTGWTTDLNARIRAHNEGRGAKYTKARRPVKAEYFEQFETKEEAMRREWEIKQLNRAEKLALIRGNSQEAREDAQTAIYFCRGLEHAPEAKWIRTAVFVEEQGFQKEFDEIDAMAEHAVLYRNGCPAATGRLFAKEGAQGTYIVGRIAVLKEYRGFHLGAAMIHALEERAVRNGVRELELTAQIQAKGFYEKLGYTAFGDLCYDEHCPHVKMCKQMKSDGR